MANDDSLMHESFPRPVNSSDGSNALKGFGSTMLVGDYEMPRAGKAGDYFTPADKKANTGIK